MSSFPFPKLKSRRTGSVIAVNASPFSVGRGLSCNYVVQSKVVSRVHCILEKTADNSWVLKDTSTNGTFVNEELIVSTTSAPLKNNDIITLDGRNIDSYVFHMENPNDEITDEQLCAIADTVLDEVDFFNSNPVGFPVYNPIGSTDEQMGAIGLPPRINTVDSTAIDPLLDHMYTAKSSDEIVKKPRVARSPRPILGCGSRRNLDTAPPLTRNDSNNPHLNPASTDSGYSSRLSPVPTASSGSGFGVVRDSVNAGFNAPISNEGSSNVAGGLRPVLRSTAVGVSGENVGRSEGVGKMVQDCNSSSSQASTVVECSSIEENVGLVSSVEDGSCNSHGVQGAALSGEPGPSTHKREKPLQKATLPDLKEQSKEPQPDHYEVMENELQCVICSELFIKALTLNCSHTFCRYCITMWNKNKSDCPICRTKITSKTSTIVLDNVIEKVIEASNEEIKQHRQTLLEERKNQEEAEKAPAAARTRPARQVARRGRSATARTGDGDQAGGNARRGGGAVGPNGAQQPDVPRINVLDPVAINIGALVNGVIEVSSDSEWSSDTESMSPYDLDGYDNDDWYDTRRPYYGGYGYCFRCGSPTHWANSCPNR